MNVTLYGIVNLSCMWNLFFSSVLRNQENKKEKKIVILVIEVDAGKCIRTVFFFKTHLYALN